MLYISLFTELQEDFLADPTLDPMDPHSVGYLKRLIVNFPVSTVLGAVLLFSTFLLCFI